MNENDFNELVDSIKEAIAVHKGAASPAEVLEIPDPKKSREKLNLSQPEFARFIGVKVATLRNWEQGRRRIPATARRLLKIAEKHPEIILEMTSAEG